MKIKPEPECFEVKEMSGWLAAFISFGSLGVLMYLILIISGNYEGIIPW